MNLKVTFVLALAVITTNAQAADFLSSNSVREFQGLFGAQETTKFQTLIDAYQTATRPAQVSDFQGPAKTCVLENKSQPDGDFSGTFAVVECANVLIPASPAHDVPATPDQGPLFPAQPAHHVPDQPEVCGPGAQTLVMGADWVHSITSDQLNVFSNQLTDTDLVIQVAKNDKGIYSDIGDNVQILIRHEGNYFPFVLHTDDKGVVFAGYCY